MLIDKCISTFYNRGQDALPQGTQRRKPPRRRGAQVTDRSDPAKKAGRSEAGELVQDLLALLVKLAVLFAAFWLTFTYVFGAQRSLSPDMIPAFRDGDLVLYYRLDRDWTAGDIAVFSYQGRSLLSRVVAVEGDTVDFDEQGLLVNGAHVQEDDIYSETTPFEEGITFPVRVGEREIFVLGDNRPHATDSRIFGCVELEDVKGKVIGLLRRRNL